MSNKIGISASLILAGICLLLPLKQSAAATCTDMAANVRVGQKGAAVVSLQKFLIESNYLKAKADGSYGSLTKAAVLSFQAKYGLVSNPAGFVGAGTRAQIKSISCGSQPAGTSTVSSTVQAAQTSPVAASGCQAGMLFNPQTGASCTVQSALPAGCAAGATFNFMTGQRCSVVQSSTQTTVAQRLPVPQFVSNGNGERNVVRRGNRLTIHAANLSDYTDIFIASKANLQAARINGRFDGGNFHIGRAWESTEGILEFAVYDNLSIPDGAYELYLVTRTLEQGGTTAASAVSEVSVSITYKNAQSDVAPVVYNNDQTSGNTQQNQITFAGAVTYTEPLAHPAVLHATWTGAGIDQSAYVHITYVRASDGQTVSDLSSSAFFNAGGASLQIPQSLLPGQYMLSFKTTSSNGMSLKATSAIFTVGSQVSIDFAPVSAPVLTTTPDMNGKTAAMRAVFTLKMSPKGIEVPAFQAGSADIDFIGPNGSVVAANLVSVETTPPGTTMSGTEATVLVTAHLANTTSLVSGFYKAELKAIRAAGKTISLGGESYQTSSVVVTR